MIRRAAPALVLVLAATAAGCGSDLGPASTPAAVPVRIQLVHASAALAAGARDAIALIGARLVPDTTQADLVVTDDPAAAAEASLRNGGTHILVVGSQPPAAPAPNARFVEFDRAGMAYLAGALAALRAPRIAVAESGGGLAPAIRAWAAAERGGDSATSVACGATTTAAVVYVPDASCRPSAPGALVIAPRRLAGARMLALLGPRPAVVVAEAARSVQDGIFQPGGLAPRESVLTDRAQRPGRHLPAGSGHGGAARGRDRLLVDLAGGPPGRGRPAAARRGQGPRRDRPRAPRRALKFPAPVHSAPRRRGRRPCHVRDRQLTQRSP